MPTRIFHLFSFFVALLIILTLVLASVSIGKGGIVEESLTHDGLVIAAYRRIRNDLDVDLDLFTSGAASKFEEILNNVNISRKCEQSLRDLFRAGARKETWAIKALDAWGKFPPSGFMSCTATSFGSYDQCVEIAQNSDFRAGYCTVLFRPLLPKRPKFHRILDKLSTFRRLNLSEIQAIDFLAGKAHFFYYIPLRIGVCLPSVCSLQEVDQLALNGGEALGCETKESRSPGLSIPGKISACVIAAILIATTVGTMFELMQHTRFRSSSFAAEILTGFSVRKNFSSLFTTRSSSAELKCLNGIRVLTISWIIVGHCGAFAHLQGFSSSFKATELLTTYIAHGMLNASLSVESFFLISGLLTSYVTIKSTNPDKTLSPFWFVFARYLRLTPAMACAVCFVFFLPYFGHGPIWKETVEPVVYACRKNWWVNLLYMQPYINPQEMCIIPTWWLANEMLFHIMSLPLIMMFIKNPGIGVWAVSTTIFAFTMATAVFSYTHDYPLASVPTMPHFGDLVPDFSANYFWKPYLHGPPFFIGLFLGTLLARKRHFKISRLQAYIGWPFSIAICFLVIYLPYSISLGHDWPKVWFTLFDSTNRIAWSMALAWMIHAMASGHGGWINAFLSHDLFTPFGKATFSIYLSHMFVVWSYVGSQQDLLQTTGLSFMTSTVFIWLVSLIVGLIWTIFFEAPFLNILKLVMNRRATRPLVGDGILNDRHGDFSTMLSQAVP